MADGAALRWTEEIVLGRHGEKPGRLSLRSDVDIDDNPLLRHQLDSARCDRAGTARPSWATNRAVGLALLDDDRRHQRRARGALVRDRAGGLGRHGPRGAGRPR